MYDYDLSGIGTGLLRLVIEGYGGEYEGYFQSELSTLILYI